MAENNTLPLPFSQIEAFCAEHPLTAEELDFLQTHQAKPYFFHRETPLLAGLVERGLATTDEIHTQQPDYRAWYITPLGQDVYANHRALRFPPGGAAFALNADEEPVAGMVVGYIRFPARLMPFARFTSGSQTWKVSALRLRSEGE